MADRRITKLEEKQNWLEQHAWKIVSTLGLAAIVWYLNGINASLKNLSDDIIDIKLADSANAARMNRLQEDVIGLKAGEKELSKRVGALERVSEKHEHQLQRLE